MNALQELGAQVRRERVRQRIDQTDVAARAGVQRSAITRLENGQGATLRTFVSVLRVLGREDWLLTLSPQAEVSPIAILRHSRAEPKRVRQTHEEREASKGKQD